MTYYLKYARAVRITYTETHEPRGWLPAGYDTEFFEDYNKNELNKILTNDGNFNIELDGNFLTTITLDNDNNQLTQTERKRLSREDQRNKGLEVAINQALHDVRDRESWLFTDVYSPMSKECPDYSINDFAFDIFKNIIDAEKQIGKVNSDGQKKYAQKIKNSPLFAEILAEKKDDKPFRYKRFRNFVGFHSESQKLVGKYNGHYFSFYLTRELEWLEVENKINSYEKEIPLKYPVSCSLQFIDIEYAFNYIIPAFYFSLAFFDFDKMDDEKVLNPFYYVWDLA